MQRATDKVQHKEKICVILKGRNINHSPPPLDVCTYNNSFSKFTVQHVAEQKSAISIERQTSCSLNV